MMWIQIDADSLKEGSTEKKSNVSEKCIQNQKKNGKGFLRSNNVFS